MSNDGFKYLEDDINKAIKKLDLHPVIMWGVKNDLKKLKPLVEDFYGENIRYLNYWIDDAPYHGWDLSSNLLEIQDMIYITTQIEEKFKEIYALILAGLGEKCEVKSD